ncbi:MAG: ATP-binding protein [Bacteroidales bacterium]|nr:ATP-binding protein [Bacteroidales bacterium]
MKDTINLQFTDQYKLIKNMHEALAVIDLKGKIQFCNQSYASMFKSNVPEIQGEKITNLILAEDAEKILSKNKKISKYKLQIHTKDNTTRIINVSSIPWKTDEGEIVGVITMFFDVTEQEQINEKLQKRISIEKMIVKISTQFISPENFSKKLDNTLKELKNIINAERYTMLFIQNNKVRLTNEQFSESAIERMKIEEVDKDFLQYSLDILKSSDFIFYDDIRELPDEAKFEKALFERYKVFNFLAIPLYSDSELSGFLTINNIYEKDKWTVEDLAILRTITEIIGHAFSRNKAEERIKKLNQDIVNKNKELEQVVYVTSHDIRSPVVNILGFSDEMFKALNKLSDKIFDSRNAINNKDDIKLLLERDIPQIMNFIKVSGQKIDKLLIALLKLSRLGQAAINKVNVDMNILVRNVIKTFEYTIKQQGIKIELGNLESCFTDEVSINQVFSNLIDNAIKYRAQNRKSVITISSTIDENNVVYCIADNGVGISEQQINKIFDVFYRVNPEIQNGEGMGLALIKKTIEQVGGKITVNSKVNTGSKFYVILEK